MDIGIFGLTLSGKTTLFALLTDVETSNVHHNQPLYGVAEIFDARLEKLSRIYNPKKTTYTTLNFTDIPGFDLSINQKEKNKIFQEIQNADSIVAVIRAFSNPTVPWPENLDSPVEQMNAVQSEFVIRDLDIVETRLKRLEEEKNKKGIDKKEQKEKKLLEKIKEHLENGNFVHQLDLDEHEKKIIGSLSLFTGKPIVFAVNLDEEQIKNEYYEGKNEIITECENNGFAYTEFSGKIEQELKELDDEERKLFMDDLGIKESGIKRFSRVVYNFVGLISFFTVSEDEVKAWTIRKGATAIAAAAKVHTDLAKHFIKAEIVHFEDFINAGNMAEAKKEGLVKLAGKDEVIHDGDILYIKANA
ncbi:MAG: redox-regulated ATPase YchF [Kosmotoga sp.]|nr:MAG: redox-regulated ATPase YchF [Kosmotoga sp.]